MDTQSLTQFIRPELLVLVPVLYVIGTVLKSNIKFDNKYIPLMLGVMSIAMCVIETLSLAPISTFQEALSAVFTAITQGILCAAASVYAHQLVKQHLTDNTQTNA